MNAAPWVVLLMIVIRGATVKAEVKKTEWGRSSDGREVKIYTLKSAHVEVRAMSYGACLVSITTVDRDGQMHLSP